MAAPSNKRNTFLVVDDHSMTRNMVRTILRSAGYTEVLIAESAQHAYSVLEENETRISCVVCDWNMPGATGLELLKEIRKESRFKNLPFLMLTAEAYRENIEAAMQAGVSDYIIKPFTAETLLVKVTSIVGPPTKDPT